MSRFANVSHDGITVVPPDTNYAGGAAFKQESKLALASLVTTSTMRPAGQYYRGVDSIETEAKRLVSEVDPLFAAKAAVYARNTDGLRTITHVVAAEVAHLARGEEWTKRFIDAVVR